LENLTKVAPNFISGGRRPQMALIRLWIRWLYPNLIWQTKIWVPKIWFLYKQQKKEKYRRKFYCITQVRHFQVQLKFAFEIWPLESVPRGGVGATRPYPRDGGAEEFCADSTIGPRPKFWTRKRVLNNWKRPDGRTPREFVPSFQPTSLRKGWDHIITMRRPDIGAVSSLSLCGSRTTINRFVIQSCDFF